VRGLAGISEARITFIGGEQRLGRPSRRIAVGLFQEFAPSFGLSEARCLFFSLSRLSAGLLACRYDKRRRPYEPRALEQRRLLRGAMRSDVVSPLAVRSFPYLGHHICMQYGSRYLVAKWHLGLTDISISMEGLGLVGAQITAAQTRRTGSVDPKLLACARASTRGSCPSHSQSSLRYPELDVQDCGSTCDI
jgi:hypothetical protein